MYLVETDAEVDEQVATLPFYAELMAMLALSPWSGEIYNRERPGTANMRTHAFGAHAEGFVIYLIEQLARMLGMHRRHAE